MKKKEFISELEVRLKGIDVDERESILNYYDELISDKMDEGLNEERVIRNLGTFEEIMRKLNIDSESGKDKIKYDSIIEDELKKEEVKRKRISLEKDDKEGRREEAKNFTKDKEDSEIKVKKQTSNSAYEKEKRGISTSTLILIILTSPIWFSLGIAAISVLFSFIVAIFCCMVSFIAIPICGVAGIVWSFTLFSTDPATAYCTLGGGIAMIGVGFILIPITWKICLYGYKIIWGGVKAILKTFMKGGN